MKQKLNLEDIKKLIKGASILTTGGGVPIEEQLKAVKSLKKLAVSLVSLNELPKDGYVCLAVELGPSAVPPIKKDKVIRKMFEFLTKISGKKVVGVYPPEIGQESVVVEAAHFLNLPIVDMDPVGGRAVPSPEIMVFNLKNISYSFTPMVVCNDIGEVFVVEGKMSLERVEEVLRTMTKLSSSELLFILGGLVSVASLIKKRLENNSYSQALNLGSIKNSQDLIKHLNPKVVIEADVTKRKLLKHQGFSAAEISLTDQSKQQYKLIVFNEALFLLDNNNQIISSVPERILLIDPKKVRGFESAKLKVGSKLLIAVLDPEEIWRSKKANKIFGKERFKYLLGGGEKNV